MADEDLLLNVPKEQPAQPSGASGIKTPTDLVNVSVFGVFKAQPVDASEKGEEYVEQKFSIQVPRGESDENISQFIWSAKFVQQLALRAVGSKGEINFYPLDLFKRFTVQVGHIHGVTL